MTEPDWREDWREVGELEAIAERGALVFKPERDGHERRQLAIIHNGERCFAIDNRCPHEGYPLSQGSVDGCVLTCNWHNWKFELDSGRNLWGGDHVRSYPVEVRDGKVFVDLADPPLEQREAEVLSGLREAFDEQDHGWIARQLARLVALGVDPVTAAMPPALRWTAPRMEWGLRHGFAATAEWLAFYDRIDARDLEARLTCLSEAIEHLAHDALRQPEFPFPEPLTPDASGFDHEGFLAAVEAEDPKRAIGSIRGAVAAGAGFAALEHSLSRAALAHYTGFGHALIYVVQVGALVERFGAEIADPALAALTRYIVHATREDLIPEFRGYTDALAAWPAQEGGAADIADAEVEALFGASLKAVFEWVLERAATHTPLAIWDALLQANARSMLCFDLARDTAAAVKVADNVGWLDFTHALTFASAIRQQCARFPELWPQALLQLACFVGRNRAYLDASITLADWRVDDEAEFWAQTDALLLDHGIGLPIYSAHLLKTSAAVATELGQVGPGTRVLLLAALNRFLHSPIRQKHARRNVHQALALIDPRRDG